jgi:hypothetical protein
MGTVPVRDSIQENSAAEHTNYSHIQASSYRSRQCFGLQIRENPGLAARARWAEGPRMPARAEVLLPRNLR